MKKQIPITIIICLCSVIFSAQNKANKKKQIRQTLREARYHLEGEDYPRSWLKFCQVLKLDSNHRSAGVQAAYSSMKLNYPVDSILFLKNNLILSKDIDSKYYLALIKHREKKFDESINLLGTYQQISATRRMHTDKEIAYNSGISTSAKQLTSNPKKSVISNMGPNINSRFPDYVPVILPDESALYFTSKRPGSSGNLKNGDNNYFEDVYVSHKTGQIWDEAHNAGEPLNTTTNDGCVAISPDGQRMIVYRTSENIESGDLYITRMGINDQWEPLQLLSKEINSPFNESSACFSNDTSEIYFSSNRPGGLGGKDIYRIKKLPNGSWSVPLNLGANVNSPYDDDAPYMHPDGVTFYFSSKGHNTMGDYDVFKSVWNAETNQFSMADNLGFPINDVGSDIFFVLSVDGQRGYYSSLKEETYGGVDIYQIDTRFGENDLKVKHGTVLVDDMPARVKITLTDNDTKKISGYFISNASTGKFIMVLNPLKSYKILIEAEGCDPATFDIGPQAYEKEEKDFVCNLSKLNAK